MSEFLTHEPKDNGIIPLDFGIIFINKNPIMGMNVVYALKCFRMNVSVD